MSADRNDELLTPAELLTRWKGKVAYATLAQWRSRKAGPAYLKLGGKVFYKVADVEAFETANRNAAGQPN